MSATFQSVFPASRLPVDREGRSVRSPRNAVALQSRERHDESHQWLVDLEALARCRSLLSGRPLTYASAATPAPLRVHQSLMDVPAAFDQFCRSHFASVRRLHPELHWADACAVYAIALSAHASLRVKLDEACETLLELHWDEVRGSSTLGWKQAHPLLWDGCSALDRLDPLAMRR